MSARSHRNKRWIGRGKVSRVPRSDRVRHHVGTLLPSLAMSPTTNGVVNEATLALEVTRLAEVGRRGGCVR